MTRAYNNYIIDGKCFTFYYNGDQYPRGLKNCFGVGAMLAAYDVSKHEYNKGATKYLFDEKRVLAYIRANYNNDRPEERTKPIIDKTEDWNYIFDFDNDKFKAYNWSEKVFEGNHNKFIEFIDNAE